MRAKANSFMALAVLCAACGGSQDEDTGPDPEAAAAEGMAQAMADQRELGGSGDPPPRAETAPEDPGAEDADRLLAAHNHYRESHCAPPLAWSEELADSASAWADELAERDCALEHSDYDAGENLAAGTAGSLDAETVVELWYEEIADYDFMAADFSPETGHFTQVVWVGSRELGCARADCPTGHDLWICHYEPRGNMLGEFSENVLPLQCDEGDAARARR